MSEADAGDASNLWLVEDIARSIKRSLDASGQVDLNLAHGLPGIAIFISRLASHPGASSQWLEIADSMLEKMLDAIPHYEFRMAGLFTGVAGVGWAISDIARVRRRVELQKEGTFADMLNVCDEYLRGIGANDFDLIFGAVGIGIWALHISERAEQQHLLSAVMACLERCAIEDRHGIKWRPCPERYALLRKTPGMTLEGFDLGLAHGAAGVVGFLARVVASGHVNRGARELLEKGTAWLCSNVLPNRVDGCFGMSTADDKAARLAWCYGDAGVAIALDRAAQVLGREDVSRCAEMVVAAAAVRLEESAGVMDGCICHGAAGLLCIFDALHARRGGEKLAAAGDYWCRNLLTRRVEEERVFYFPTWNSIDREYIGTYSLLTGATGIGLALLSREPEAVDRAWTEPFLI